MTIDERKDDHIEICLNKDVRISHNHWDEVHLVHQAVPSTDLDEVNLETTFLGKDLMAPMVISAMTGGSKKAMEFNRRLARAASEFGIGFGVGSQRAGLKKPEYGSTYSVIKEFDLPFKMANLGAPQFASKNRGKVSSEYGLEEVHRAMEMIDADAICIHLNYLQEVVQPEGDTNATGFLDNLKEIAGNVKVIVKETGAGISRRAALDLKEAGVAAIDIGGASGTSFSAVESFRSTNVDGRASRLGSTYREWGIPTPVSLKLAKVGVPLIATGGLRTGLDVVKALALGADLGGMAWPLLLPASIGFDKLERTLSYIIEEIKIGLFLSGVSSVQEAGRLSHSFTGITRDLMQGITV